jgi:hypothetical protein
MLVNNKRLVVASVGSGSRPLLLGTPAKSNLFGFSVKISSFSVGTVPIVARFGLIYYLVEVPMITSLGETGS